MRWILPLAALLIAACTHGGPTADQTRRTIQVTSPAFDAGQPIPVRHTADGANVSPPLTWRNLPPDTQALALIVDDPDAPRPQPWVLYGLSPDLDGLPQGIPTQPALDQPIQARQGQNSSQDDNIGYTGPAPPPPDAPHHYHFTLYALDRPLNLQPGATKDQLLEAMQGHILATGELVGTYDRESR